MRTRVLAASLLMLIAGSAGGTNYYLEADGTGDFATIQAAIDAAGSGDVILLADGVYTGAGNRDLDFGGRNLVVKSVYGPAACIIDCQGLGRGFVFAAGEDSTSAVWGVTITNGDAVDGGGIYVNTTAACGPTLRNNVISYCSASGDGGGIWIGGRTKVIHDRLSRNTAGGNGGGIYVADGVTLSDNLIDYNSAARGGGVYYAGGYGRIACNIVAENTAATSGGGFHLNDTGVDLENCLIVRNHAPDYGSAIFTTDDIGLKGSTVAGNQDPWPGGAIHGSDGGGTWITNSIVWQEYIVNAVMNYSCFKYTWPSGTGNITDNPQFVDGPASQFDDYYLDPNSPCVNTGGYGPPETTCFETGLGTFCYGSFTTRADETDDTGVIDRGYHYGHYNPVYVPDDQATIQAAIDAANPWDVVVVRAGTYHENLDFGGAAVTVQSEAGPATTIIDGDDNASVVAFVSGEDYDAVLSGFTVTDGQSSWGGGVLCTVGSHPTISGNVIDLNTATTDGGGVHCGGGARPLLVGNTIKRNDAALIGGGVSCHLGSDPILVDNELSYNTATAGGAIGSEGTCYPLLVDCLLNANSADAGGGAYALTLGETHLLRCTLVGNSASQYGGGAAAVATGAIRVDNCTFYANNASLGGSCVAQSSGALAITNSILSFGQTTSATHCISGSLTLACSDVFANGGGDFVGCIAGLEGVDGNFSADPVFCYPSAADLTLRANSPCAPANNPGCGQVGAHGVGCAYTPVTRVVDPGGGGDFLRIQDAIDASYHGDTIELVDATYSGDRNRDLDCLGLAITIRSQSGNPTACAIDCDGTASLFHRGFYFQQGEGPDCVIRDLTITDGYSDNGGGIRCNGASPTLINVTVTSCTATLGGGIYASSGSPELQDCSIIGNTALSDGGGMYAKYSTSTPSLAGCVIRDNSAVGSGGGYYERESASTTFDACVFAGNSSNLGGGYYNVFSCHPTMSRCTFVDNITTSYGGALRIYTNSSADLSHTIVWANSGPQIRVNSTSIVTIDCSDVEGGAAAVDYDAGSTLSWGGDNLTSDPIFCDASAGDYSLRDDSPCADANSPVCGQIGALGVGCSAGPVTYTVCPDGSGDYTTIQAAITAAGDGDTIELCDGTYTGSGNRDLDYGGRAITVRSASGDPAACIIDCQGNAGDQHRGVVFQSQEGADSVLRGVTVRNAYSWHAAGLFCEAGSSPRIAHCIFENNTAESRGGGLSAHNGSAPTIEYCVFRNNTAMSDGAGLRCYDGTPTVADCEFYGNTAGATGGAVHLNINSSASFLRCSFHDNHCTTDGGAIYATNGSAPSLEDCLVYDNVADRNGGAIYLWQQADVALLRCTIAGNRGLDASGFSVNYHSSPSLTNCIVAVGIDGPAVYCDGTSGATLACCDVFGNAGGNWIGAIAGQAGTAGNLETDPEFCDLGGGHFSLRSTSPCAAANNSGCGQIGAQGVGCGNWVVDPSGGGDFTTIQAAIDACSHGDVIELVDATYNGAGNRDLDDREKTFTLRSLSEDPTACVIDCQGSESEPHRGLRIDGGQSSALVLRGLTITNAWYDYGGGMQVTNGSSPTIQNCVFSHSSSTDGGGIFVMGASTPAIVDCLFHDNSATNAGGNLRLSSSGGSVTGCEFRDGFGYWGGGGIYVYLSDPVISDCVYANNGCHAWGSHMAIHGVESSITITGCTFFGGVSPDGSIRLRGEAAPTFEDCLFAFSEQGSAVSCDASGASATMVCCDIYGNGGGDWVGCISEQLGSGGNLAADPLLCDVANLDLRLAADSPCLPENNGCSQQIGALGYGCAGVTAVEDGNDVPTPTTFALFRNYPNPFNPRTSIVFELPQAERVALTVYGIDGRLVRELVDAQLPAGRHVAVWDGTDTRGRRVASGTYFYRIAAGSYRKTESMLLLK
jgi:predicted outer membrane repeat protein